MALAAVRGRFAHAPAEAAAGHRTRRTKPSTTLPQPTPHRVCKTWLGSRFGATTAGERANHPPPSRGPGGKQRCLADVNACRATLSPRYGHDLHVARMARPVSRYGVEIRSPVQYSGSVASPAGRTRQRARECVCVCVRACVRVCMRVCARARVCARRRWRGTRSPQCRRWQAGRPFQCSHCGGEPSKSSSVSSCSSSSISSSPPSS